MVFLESVFPSAKYAVTVEPTGRVAATLLSSLAEAASSSDVQHGAGEVMMTALSSGKCTSTREPAQSMAAASRITSRAPPFNRTNPALAAPPTGPDIPRPDVVARGIAYISRYQTSRRARGRN